MKRDAAKKQVDSGAKAKIKSSVSKSPLKKSETIVEKKVKSLKPKPEPKKSAPKSANINSGKITKQPAKTKPAIEKRKTAAIPEKAKPKSKTTPVQKVSKPTAAQKTIKNPNVKPPLKKKETAFAKNPKQNLKKVKTVSDSPKPKPQSQKNNLSVSVKKTKVPVKNIEPAKATVKKPARKKPVKPIGLAVFRGIKEQYDFKVFPINEEFEAVKAVYIISKRKTDRQKRGHHKLVCIGQTDSILEEIKKHRKSRCLRQNEANVISILPEENESKRLKIETDLKAAHSIACNLA